MASGTGDSDGEKALGLNEARRRLDAAAPAPQCAGSDRPRREDSPTTSSPPRTWRDRRPVAKQPEVAAEAWGLRRVRALPDDVLPGSFPSFPCHPESLLRGSGTDQF